MEEARDDTAVPPVHEVGVFTKGHVRIAIVVASTIHIVIAQHTINFSMRASKEDVSNHHRYAKFKNENSEGHILEIHSQRQRGQCRK
jgi:hypothetical protein